MCATYTYKKDAVREKLREAITAYGAAPQAKIRPTDLGPVVVPEFAGLAVREYRWGWSVPWEKRPLINAKAETLTQLPTFRAHLEQRCLLPADGFYEGGVWFHQPGEAIFCFAGLWRPLQAATTGGDVSGCFVMLTTSPNESVAKFHNRMPFIVRPDDFADWLRGDWQRVLNAPDMSPLEMFQKQPELF
jgi:putative SOS response-associated peptidase YedK